METKADPPTAIGAYSGILLRARESCLKPKARCCRTYLAGYPIHIAQEVRLRRFPHELTMSCVMRPLLPLRPVALSLEQNHQRHWSPHLRLLKVSQGEEMPLFLYPVFRWSANSDSSLLSWLKALKFWLPFGYPSYEIMLWVAKRYNTQESEK